MADPARVLVVDDEQMMRDLVNALLETDGYVVELAPEGASALRAIDANRPDLVLLAAEPKVFAQPRREPRRTVLVPVTLLSPEGTPTAMGQILNLSPGGVQLDLGAAFPPGMTVMLSFDIPGGHGPFRLNGRIQWEKDGKLGLSFVDVSDQDRQRLEDLLVRS